MKNKILIVDDSGMSRRTMRKILETDGYEVIEAEDGLIALEKYALEKPDLVMLDLTMAGMYGLDVLKNLRQMNPQVRVIIASADIQSSSQEMAISEGAKGFIIKPFNSGKVLSAVNAVLKEGVK
jgi:two-component system chemotaxis response regulator CheY